MVFNPRYFDPRKRKYTKRNYDEAIKIIVPGMYLQDDLDLSGTELDPIEDIINSHVRAADIMSTAGSGLFVSAIPGTYLSSINNASGLSHYFIKQNNLTRITPEDFERFILHPLSVSIKSFDTSNSFGAFVSGTLLPRITIDHFEDNLRKTGGVYADSPSGTHKYLIENLSWLYFLNSSGSPGASSSPTPIWRTDRSTEYYRKGRRYDGSSIVSGLMVHKLYAGQTIELNDAMKAFSEYLFRNYEVCGGWRDNNLIPAKYRPFNHLPSGIGGGFSGTWTSGTQQLDKLNTLVDVIYSPKLMDIHDDKVKDAFFKYLVHKSGLGDTLFTKQLSGTVGAGPFHKLLKAYSYSFADVTDKVENINALYDIEQCPKQFLPYIADLIGWNLLGSDPERHRLQLKNAVDIYKRSGTKESIQIATNALFADALNVSGDVHELWESYIPFLAYYAIATESKYFRTFDDWTPDLAQRLGVKGYSISSMDDNIRHAVDTILLHLVALHPKAFIFNYKPFPITVATDRKATLPPGKKVPDLFVTLHDPDFIFDYRGRDYPIPPFEEIPYYLQCEITDQFVNDLAELLACFGVRRSFAVDVKEYIKDNTLRSQDKFRDGNGWLIFTSGVNDPPNFEKIVSNPAKYRTEVLSMWNGKSSHFKVFLEADRFDFTVDTLTNAGKYAPIYAAKLAREFSPAHSVPDIRLETSAIDEYRPGNEANKSEGPADIKVNPNKSEFYTGYGLIETSSGGFTTGGGVGAASGARTRYPTGLARAGVSGTHFDGWRRTRYGGKRELFRQQRSQDSDDNYVLFKQGGGKQFLRRDVNSIYGLLASGITLPDVEETPVPGTLGGVVEVERNAFRRRNFKMTLPTEGYYDRTGFNMPISWDASTVEKTVTVKEEMPSEEEIPTRTMSVGFLPLGYIPSTGQFYSISSYDNLPDVYHICEDSGSSSIFSGVPSASSFLCRGASGLNNDAYYNIGATWERHDNYVDRGQTPPIIRVMHAIREREKLAKAEYYVSSNFDDFAYFYTSLNAEQSFANSSTEFDSWFPNNVDDYYNYQFGRGVHQLYNAYTKYFRRHLLRPDTLYNNGPTIFSHAWGPLLFNSNFDLSGPNSSVKGSSVISTHLNSTSSLTLDHPSFSGSVVPQANGRPWSGYAHGNHYLSAGEGIMASGAGQTLEIRNRNIISGVEFIHVSGSSPLNSFQLFRIDRAGAKGFGEDYFVDNTLIKLKAIDGLSRLRFSVKETSGLTTEALSSTYGYQRDDNTLIPDHEFKLSIRNIIGEENGKYLGGAKLGVWIHTEGEGPYFWSYTPKGVWQMNEVSGIGRKTILDELTHYYVPPKESPPKLPFRCIDVVKQGNNVINNPSVITEFDKGDYRTAEFTFNTCNNCKCGMKTISLTPDRKYHETYRDVHKDIQNYVIEIFMIPDSTNDTKFALIDEVSIVDLTLNEKTRYDASGTLHSIPLLENRGEFCDSVKVQITRDELREIFRFFNSSVGVGAALPYASRGGPMAGKSGADTSGIYGVSGGGRLSYRQAPEWYYFEKQSGYNNFTRLEIVN